MNYIQIEKEVIDLDEVAHIWSGTNWGDPIHGIKANPKIGFILKNNRESYSIYFQDSSIRDEKFNKILTLLNPKIL